MASQDFLLLKWGNVKAYDFSNSPEAMKALKEWIETEVPYSVMGHDNTPRQRELICRMIDAVNGSFTIYWGNEDCTNDREKAKKYVMEYGKEHGKDSVDIDTKNSRKSIFEIVESFKKFLKS
jgi:hypothetical protein